MPGTRSLAIVGPDTTINFLQNINGVPVAEARHTVTSLLWPSTAHADELIDQAAANQDNHHVTLRTPGLYVYVCKLHPYMLGAVIVDDKTTEGLDIGKQLTLLVQREVTDTKNLTFNSYSDLTLRLLRAFFIVTDPSNWKDYTKVGTYQPAYPDVPVRVCTSSCGPHDGKPTYIVASLQGATLSKNFDGKPIPTQVKPPTKGVGEVWVDTQFELTTKKGPSFPGTISVVKVDALVAANNWKVKKKITGFESKVSQRYLNRNSWLAEVWSMSSARTCASN
jgi:hypothetical protein